MLYFLQNDYFFNPNTQTVFAQEISIELKLIESLDSVFKTLPTQQMQQVQWAKKSTLF